MTWVIDITINEVSESIEVDVDGNITWTTEVIELPIQEREILMSNVRSVYEWLKANGGTHFEMEET